MPQRMRVEIALIGGIVCFCCWCAYILVRMNSSVVAEQPAGSQQSRLQVPMAPSELASPGVGGVRQLAANNYQIDPQAASSARVNSQSPPQTLPLPQGFYPATQVPAAIRPQLMGSRGPFGLPQVTSHVLSQQRIPEANSPAVFYVNHPERSPPVWAQNGQQAGAPGLRWRPQQPYHQHLMQAPVAESEAHQTQQESVDPTTTDETASEETEPETTSGDNEEGEDASATTGDDQQPESELEERTGERSFSENQADATERDRHGRPVRVYQRHLVNGKPVAMKGARDKQADFDSLVQEIDNQEQEQDQDQSDYDDAPDSSNKNSDKPRSTKSRQRNRRHDDRLQSGTKLTTSRRRDKTKGFQRRGKPVKKDSRQHRLSETLTARRWDDDSTLAKGDKDGGAPSSENDDGAGGAVDEIEDAEQHEQAGKITTVEDLDNLDKLSGAAGGGLFRFPLESARRKKRQIVGSLSAQDQPSESRLPMVSARETRNNTLVKGQLDQQHLPAQRTRRKRQAPANETGANPSTFGQRIGYQPENINLTVPYQQSAYDYPIQPPTPSNQNGAFQVTITTNLDQQPPGAQPVPGSHLDYSSVTAQPVAAAQPGVGQLIPTPPVDLSGLPHLGGAQTQESHPSFAGQPFTLANQNVQGEWPRKEPATLKDVDWPHDPNLVAESYDPTRSARTTKRRPEASESKKHKKKVIKKKMKFQKSKMSDSKYKAAKAQKSKVKKGKMKRKKHKAKKKVLKKSKQFQGATRGNKGQKGAGQQGSNKGAIYYKDRGFKKRGFKKAYRKLEAGDHKTYFDEFRDKDHKKKWKKFKDKHHYSQNKKWSGKEAKKYKNYDFKEHKDKKSGSGQWKEKASSKFQKDYKRKSGGGDSKLKKKKKKVKD